MIEIAKGELLKVEAGALVNTIKCAGIMGKESPCNKKWLSRKISNSIIKPAKTKKSVSSGCSAALGM